MANPGDTFLLTKRDINSHLFVIISDPNQDANQIVTVNVTSWREDKDQSCIIEASEHRFITHRSCIYYGEDRLITLSQYKMFLAMGHLESHDPINNQLLKRILDGAAISPHMPLRNRQILVDQGLIY